MESFWAVNQIAILHWRYLGFEKKKGNIEQQMKCYVVNKMVLTNALNNRDKILNNVVFLQNRDNFWYEFIYIVHSYLSDNSEKNNFYL